MGVVQLFNKEEGINKIDLQLIESVQRLLGAAATRVSIVTSSLTVMIGLTMSVDNSLSQMEVLEKNLTT